MWHQTVDYCPVCYGGRVLYGDAIYNEYDVHLACTILVWVDCWLTYAVGSWQQRNGRFLYRHISQVSNQVSKPLCKPLLKLSIKQSSKQDSNDSKEIHHE